MNTGWVVLNSYARGLAAGRAMLTKNGRRHDSVIKKNITCLGPGRPFH